MGSETETNNVKTNGGPVPALHRPHHLSNPYQSVGDFLSNTDKFQIIESTLREGEQFANAFFDTGMSQFHILWN